jgi:hypothetical protein
MFRTGSAVCSGSGCFAKPLYSGLTKTFSDGGSSFNPTIWLPRLSISSYCSPTSLQKRGTKPLHNTTPHRNRQFSNMSSTKEYRLLCLENPLLGKCARHYSQLSVPLGAIRLFPFLPALLMSEPSVPPKLWLT